MTHIEILKLHEADEYIVEWASNYPDFATAWDACPRPDWMLWLHDKGIIEISDRALCLFACDYIRYAPIGDGRTMWDLLTDERNRNAVEMSERYANGDATDDELRAVRDVAWNVAWNAAWDMAVAAEADAVVAADAKAGDDAFQADLLRKRAGNPFVRKK